MSPGCVDLPSSTPPQGDGGRHVSEEAFQMIPVPARLNAIPREASHKNHLPEPRQPLDS